MIPVVLAEFLATSHATSYCDAIEATYFDTQQNSVHVFDGRADQTSFSKSGGIGLKVWRGDCWGYAYTESLHQEALQTTLQLACEHTSIATPDPCDRPIEKSSTLQAPLISQTAPVYSVETLLELALDLETKVKASHPAIFNVTDGTLAQAQESFGIINTLGHAATFSNSVAAAAISAMARSTANDVTVNPWYESFSTSTAAPDPNEMASWIGMETARRLQRAVGLPESPVIVFHPLAGRALLRRFETIFSAEAVMHHMSVLDGLQGQMIASPLITIIDDPRHGPAPRCIDGDGKPADSATLIDAGNLKAFLSNDYIARRTGVVGSARASRSLKSPRGISSSHLYLKPGDLSEAEMMESIGDGILIMDIAGAGASPITGDFSYGAIGHVFRCGEITGFADGFTIAGNILSLLKDTVLVGGGLKFEIPSLWGACGMPYIAVKSLSVGL